jgi:hypothetical protein
VITTATAFERTRAEGRAALVGYLPAGYPDVPGAIEALQVMVDCGCDVIEIGLPYSDPVMDGPTIQAAAQRALEGGVRTTDVLRTVEAVAATGRGRLVFGALQTEVCLSFAVIEALKANATIGKFAVLGVENVGPQVGRELRSQGFWAVALSLLGMLIYIWFRFELRFGVGAVMA